MDISLAAKECKSCLRNPSILSIREKEKGNLAFVRLLGMKIICDKCKKFIEEYHQHHQDTLHPDDSTIRIVIDKWNAIN